MAYRKFLHFIDELEDLEDVPGGKDLEEMSSDELLDKATSLGINLEDDLTRSEIIDLIRKREMSQAFADDDRIIFVC